MNVAALVEPPGPNCTVTLLLSNDQFAGVNNHEMFPPSWNVRSTGGNWPGGNVMLMNSCGGGMRQFP